MDTISLKQYIFDNEKVEFVLGKIGCHHIQYHPLKEYYSCANWNGNNNGAINVFNNKYLNVRNYTRESEFGNNSDIITLVQYNKQLSFISAVKYLHKILDLDYKWQKPIKKEKKFDPLEIFRKVESCHKTNVADIHVLDEDLLDDYIPMLYIGWLREGIMPWSAKKFGLAYSYKRKRVIIPHRYWLTGELVGYNARTTVDNYEELGISKYWITPSYQKSLNLYGLYEHRIEIEKAGYITIFEGEKSTLKRDSLLDCTGVSISGKTLSEEQIRIINGLKIHEVVLAFDKDVPIEEVRFCCEKLWKTKKVSYIYDKWNLLQDKQSPADVSNKIYQFLFKYRITYDKEERQLYQKDLKKK